MPEARHRFAPVALGGLAAGALAAIAGNQDWATSEAGGAARAATLGSPSSISDASAPPVTALALVLLATWGVVLVARGRPRRAVTWLGLLAALGVLGFAVAAWLNAPELLASTGVGGAGGAGGPGGTTADADTTRTLWSYVGVAAGLACAFTSVLAVRSVRHWPEMGRRYDAPGDDSAPQPDGVPLEEQTNLDLWRAIDEGRDPTEEPTH